ncbi:MAG: AraC family transcriptional regulator [Alistipes sp.]|nr:AraC family transcriptional regulator [Alistipes sp.]
MADFVGNSLKYLAISPHDEEWGLVVTTVGTQTIEPNACYPAMQHPETYDFIPQNGRILDEFQIVYITEGSGYFESHSIPRQTVEAGTAILLFPGEQHSYAPNQQQGWCEFWIGFRGKQVEQLLSSEFLTPREALIKIGLSNSIVALYRDAIRLAEKEKIGCQQLLAGVVMHMLGHILYKSRNSREGSNRTEDIINEARQLMRERVHHSLHAEEIADALGVGYSWFRQSFKRITGISPAQYIARLLTSRAKEMLISEHQTITETAYALGFESVGQFSTLFRKIEGITPRQFREENRLSYSND